MQVFHHVCIIYVWMTALSLAGPGFASNAALIFLACVTRILLIATLLCIISNRNNAFLNLSLTGLQDIPFLPLKLRPLLPHLVPQLISC